VFTLKSDHGFSFIEIIVVLAIISVCVGITAASISNVSASQASKCAQEMNSILSKCRIRAMSRAASVSIKFYRNKDGDVIADYIENGITVSEDKMGNARAHVVYVTDTQHELNTSGATPLYLTFRRETGALKTLESNGITEATQQCTAIIISGGGQTYTIHLVPTTGMHTLEG